MMKIGEPVWVDANGVRYLVEVTEFSQDGISGYYRVKWNGVLENWMTDIDGIKAVGLFPWKSIKKVVVP